MEKELKQDWHVFIEGEDTLLFSVSALLSLMVNEKVPEDAQLRVEQILGHSALEQHQHDLGQVYFNRKALDLCYTFEGIEKGGLLFFVDDEDGQSLSPSFLMCDEEGKYLNVSRYNHDDDDDY